ncbi:LytR/AlgR family response regulator transcription factor [Flavobacterium sp.]|jgi:two-component system LytT family response regulator|uniref:LytR/AlgR family response regulator transcription factor n=1 Tax=Flavobacterium sp. TaxID=239 RepID=UPI0037BF31AD
MKCVIIDDEPLAIELLESYVNKTNLLTLKGSFTNPFKALSFLIEEDVDLVFIDINMPELNGLQLLKSLSKQPMVIFTTAYPEYGVESYEYNAIDYLLKPITYQRFFKGVNKAYEQFKKNSTDYQELPLKVSNDEKLPANQFIFVKSSTKIHKIELNDIFFIEGAGNYWSFQLKDKKILSLYTYQEIAKLLPTDEFIRIHKSFIVSKSKINVIEKHQVTIGNKKIPIGLTYRELFFINLNNENNEKN